MRLVTTAGIFLNFMGGLRAQPSTQASPIKASHGHVWKTAKVVDSSTAKTYVDGAVGSHVTLTGTIHDNELAIVSDEFAYIINDTRKPYTGSPRPGAALAGGIAHAIAARHHGCRFIVGDEVKFYQVKDVIHVIDADGKECKTEILRQERVNQTA